MDGIFGIGLGEMVIIVLVILVVGGPENMVKWSRQAGKYMRDIRMMWNEFSKDIEKEIGAEGRELLDASRQLTKGMNDFRTVADPKKLVGHATRMVNDSLKIEEKEEKVEAPSINGKYNDWTPHAPEKRD